VDISFFAANARAASRERAGVPDLHVYDVAFAADFRVMKVQLVPIMVQTALLLGISPLVSGCIKNWKAKLQNRRGPSIWQVYFDLGKFMRKDMVISEHASWIFSITPYVLFLTALLAGLMVPMISEQAPLSIFGGLLAVIYLLALGRFFLALAGLDTASAFGGMGSSREMTISAIAEPAMMLSIFTVAITAGTSTNLSQIVVASHGPAWQFLNPAHVLAFAALFIVLVAETGRIPVDNPATHLELTMIHEAMVLEYSGRYLGLVEWSVSLKQLVLMALLVNLFFPVGIARDWSLLALGASTLFFCLKLVGLAGVVVLVESSNAKLRLFRVPDLLSAAFVLAALALLSTFLFK
jgi:formate hydrogenlyase subunit 4